MSSTSVAARLRGFRQRVAAVRPAFADLFTQEFSWSNGHWTAVLNGCAFAPSILTYWFVNGILDFSTAVVLGTVAAPGGLQARIIAYLLAAPVFLSFRIGCYLAHPVHRKMVLTGTCPQAELLSLDWFTVGIIMTGLPLAFRDLGPWIGMNVVFVLGIFVLPRFVGDERRSLLLKVGSIILGTVLFLYANYGGLVAGRLPFVPVPSSVLGPVVTLTLPETTLDLLLRIINSALVGPPLVAALGFLLNRIMTHPALTGIPVLHHTLPRRDPWRVVAVSSMTGTLFYLGFIAAFTGHLILVP